MLILAADTSGSACSACLFENGKVLAESFLSLGLTHSQTFMPMVHELMARSGRSYPELDAFACTVGPGSFTGIRIGVSAVKAMAAVAEKPAVPVSSLRALAFPFLTEAGTLVVAMTDARNRRVFSTAYYEGREIMPEEARGIDELVRLIGEWSSENGYGPLRMHLCGDAARLYAAESFFADAAGPGPFGNEIQPRSVASLAEESLRELLPEQRPIEIYSAEALRPAYRAKTSAERMFPNAKVPGVE